MISHIPAWIRNKYFIAVAVFTLIILFFDKNDLFTQSGRSHQLKELQQSRQYYVDLISAERKDLEQLKSNSGTIERFAREKYLMKKDDEDLFIIPEKPLNAKN